MHETADELLLLTARLPATALEADADDVLVLPFESRERLRQRVTLASGREAGLMLPRGAVLRGGETLTGAGGVTVRVEAAPEPLSVVRLEAPLALARIAYHLGNRHVPVELGDGWLSYRSDPVLDVMVSGLGAACAHETAPFEPEAGAYAGHGHGHEH